MKILIIGAGPGGYRAAHYAALLGVQVILVEGKAMGGTCLNCGCIPTKTLARNAEVAEMIRQSTRFGFHASDVTIDYQQMLDRKNHVIEQLRSGVEQLMAHPNITVVRGNARFVDVHTVSVDGCLYDADKIIIATGTVPKILPIKGTELPHVLTSTELLDLTYLPKQLVIIGAGVIGMEFASIYCSLGVQVTVIEYLKECIPVLDSDISRRLRKSIEKRGVRFIMQAQVSEITPEHVVYQHKNITTMIDADTVLMATGRQVDTTGLGLEYVEVTYDKGGIITDEDYVTSQPDIYAVGDVNGKQMLAHAATMQGIHAVNHIMHISDAIRMDIMPAAIFTYPEAAYVGKSEDVLKLENKEYTVRKGFYRANGKALAMGESDGMIKLITDKDDRIIGCHGYGAHAADLIQEVSALMTTNINFGNLQQIVHIHPTLSEILQDMH